MRLLDRIIRLVLVVCMITLGGYIMIRAVTIAGENGMFDNFSVVSAVYNKLEEYATGTYMPVISYVKQGQAETISITDVMYQTFYPVIFFRRENQKEMINVESKEEYELIIMAEARAEEEKRPQNIKEWIRVQKQRETEAEAEQEETPEQKQAEYETLLYRYFSMDVSTSIDKERLNNSLLNRRYKLDKKRRGPQILIYHTHSQEEFTDSIQGDDTTTIVGVGDYLTQLLQKEYGYEVIHDRGVYDLVNGILDRNAAYDYSANAVEKWLSKYPQIQVVIDLHRDGVDGKKFVTIYNGKNTAQLMFIIGLSRDAQGQDISYLPNPYVEDNLAFALQMQQKAEADFPGLMRNIYLMAYRFNLHYRPMSILLEAGTQLNTLEEEKNAMEAFAELLNRQLRAG